MKIFRFLLRNAWRKRKSAAASGMLKILPAYEFAMKPRRAKQRNRALTRIEVVVIIAALAILATLFLPALPKAKRRAGRKIHCVNYINQISVTTNRLAIP